jgi:pimeloyl-ACP methyl ester carboxylesterase
MAQRQTDCVQTFGDPRGRPVIYFHGTPGSPAEAELIASAASEAGVRLLAVDRAQIAPHAAGEDYLMALKATVVGACGGERVPILGFSIGAALALRVASRMGGRTGPLLLFSTAGPLDLPGAFEGMGGGARIFRAAQAGGRMFDIAVAGQSLLAARAPDVLRRMLFAGAEASDEAFAASPGGRALLKGVLRQSLGHATAGYRRDVLTYVEAWSGELERVEGPVSLWHGARDTWAPLAMAHTVAKRCGASLSVLEAGHYTTLIAGAAEAFVSLQPG